MSIDLWAELNRTNRAYCASLGLSAGELYGTPPNEAEIETSLNVTITRLNAMGPLKGMSGHTTPRPAPAFHAVVEYTRTPEHIAEQNRRFGEALDKFYAESRRRTIAPVFCGD
jgi:hypothetical protein